MSDGLPRLLNDEVGAKSWLTGGNSAWDVCGVPFTTGKSIFSPGGEMEEEM